ncbi:hypothetical protein BGZ59_002873, partial [Podila verticillata]
KIQQPLQMSQGSLLSAPLQTSKLAIGSKQRAYWGSICSSISTTCRFSSFAFVFMKSGPETSNLSIKAVIPTGSPVPGPVVMAPP